MEENIWTSKGTLYPEDITGGVVSDEEDDDQILAIGATCVSTFQPARNQWSQRVTNRCMRDAREGHCIAAMEGRIYAIGGRVLEALLAYSYLHRVVETS